MDVRKILLVAAFSAVLLIGWLGLPDQGAAQEPVTITFDPVEVGVAETAMLEARIDCPAGGCGSFHLILSFDRELIRIKRAELGPFLGDQAFEATNNIDNPAGKVELAAESVAPPPDAENLLFALEVYGLVEGTSPITVDLLEITNVTRSTVPAASEGASVTIFETGKIAFFSPPSDEWEVVFVSDRDGNPEIYAMSADGSNVRRLTDHDMLDGGPQWSPDGSQIAFFTARDGNLEIYVMDENGDNLRRLTDDPAPDYDPAWSPDGSQIMFVSERDGNPDVYVMAASDGANPQRLTETEERESVPAWSPDSREIAYNVGNDPVAVQVMGAEGANPRALIDLFGASGWHPDWSPNAALISFAVDRDGDADVYTIRRDGSEPTRLTPESSWPTSTAFAPDGGWIGYLAGYTGFSDLYVVNTDGTRIFRLTETNFDDSEPDWRTIAQPTICAIRTDQELEVETRVGPGINRGIFGFLPANQNLVVLGQALDNDGNVWYQIDKTQIPGTEMVNSLWVAAEDILFAGSCANVAFADAPPFIPDTSVPDTPPGTWGGCGSCDTCGHPGECVTSPEGLCLWDPGTCHVPPPPPNVTPPPGATQPPPPSTNCYRLALGTSPPGYGTISASPGYNCTTGSGYREGTTVTITATPTLSGAYFSFWSGDCPGMGGGSTMSITMTQTCSVTAHFDILSSPLR